AVAVEDEVVVAADLVHEDKRLAVPRDMTLHDPRPAMRLVDLIGTGRKVDEDFGSRGGEFRDRILAAFGLEVIRRVWFAEPGVLADVHAKFLSAEFHRPC